MLTRLIRAAIAFAATVMLYQGYVVLAVPFLEPAGAAEQIVQALSEDQLRRPPAALANYRELLSTYFPADHWCLKHVPKIIENNHAMIVLDSYDQTDSGELRVPRCALIFFPAARDRGAPPPRDAVILEPAGGVTLQLDGRLGQGFGAAGRMQFGQLLGEVRVRSDMREPGPDDDLSIVTKDLYMNEELIRTTEAVTMSLGQHHGRGRGLEIHFSKADADSPTAPATLFGKLDTLEISHDVAALVAPGKWTLFGEETAGGRLQPAGGTGPRDRLVEAPAEIKCSGPFRVDFDNHVATFSDNVQVWQAHPDGTLDELLAKEVTLYFAETREWGGDPAADGSRVASIRLEPATIEAVGGRDAPVVLNAPSHGAVATGERLYIELIPRKVTLDGGDGASLIYRGAEVHAPMVTYELPPRGSDQRLGLMAARGGGGWLRAAPNGQRPNEVLNVRWTQSMQLVRRGGQPVLVLDGRPRVESLGLGTLWADQLELYLRETGGAPPTPTAANGREAWPAAIEPERVVASGHVGIESAELNGKVNRLEFKLRNDATVPPAASPAIAGGDARAIVPAGGPAPLFPAARGGPRRTYSISGSELIIEAVVRDRRPQVTNIRVDGGVVFAESAPDASGEAPLRILAEHVAIANADGPNATIEIRGGDAAGTLPAGLAEISSRGMVLKAPALALSRGTSQAWVNSPGEVQLLMSRDAAGQPLARPQPLAITWAESMRLDRDRITFMGNVHVAHADGWLKTRRLACALTAPVQFDGAGSGQGPELAQLECWEGAVAEFDQRDAAGAVTAHQRIQVISLIVNQVTGEIRGDGPGHVDSVHFSKGDGAWRVLPDSVDSKLDMPGSIPQIDPPGPPKLRHLSIDFVRGVDGNLHTPEVLVYGDVRTIYGPVESWDQRLAMSPSGRPGPETIWITCDALRVVDSPLARIQTPTADGRRRAFGQVELSAETNVVIEGEHAQHGAFTLRGHRATYDQAKTMFVLQGDGRSPAAVTYQRFPGAPFEEQTAQKILYWQNTGDLRIEGSHKLEMSNFK